MVIGEVSRSLLANLILHSGGSQAKEAFGIISLYARLEEGIEGVIHMV